MEKKENKSFISSFLTLGIGTLIYLVVGLIGTPIITRIVDPVDYGRISMFNVYGNIGMMVCGLGLDQTFVRFFYKEDSINYKSSLLRYCLKFSFALTLIVGLLFICAVHWGFKLAALDEGVLLVLSIIVLLLHRYALLSARLRYHSRLYSAANIAQKAIYIALAVSLICIYNQHHYRLLVYSTILSTLVASLVAILYERELWHLPERNYVFPLKHAELLRYGLPFMVSNGISMVFNAMAKLFINHYCTKAEVGIYASAMNLMMVFSIVRTSFNALWMPSAIEHYEKNPEGKSFYQNGNAFISIIMIGFGATLILCKDLFALLLGEKYKMASMVIPYLIFEPIMYTVSETTATGIFVAKKPIYQVFVSGVSCLVSFIVNLCLTPKLGIEGAAIATAVAYAVFFGLRTALSNRVFYVKYKIKSFVISMGVLAVFAFYGSRHEFSPIQLVIYVLVLGVTVLVYSAEFKRAFQYIKPILRKTMSRKS